jgi:hypothetical protein
MMERICLAADDWIERQKESKDVNILSVPFRKIALFFRLLLATFLIQTKPYVGYIFVDYSERNIIPIDPQL